jgi:hypothetical protein
MNQDRLSVIVRMVVLGWSASLLTASYLGIIKTLDATFIAGLLTSTLGSFGLSVIGKEPEKKPPGTKPLTPPPTRTPKP